jgi:putative membrane protein
MIDLAIRIGINAAALIVAAVVVPGIHLTTKPLDEQWLKIAVVALIFAVINSFLKPIVKKLTLPISLLTLGLVGIVINAGMLLLLSYVAGALKLPFKVGTFPPTFNLDTIVAAVLGALIVSIVAAVLGMAMAPRRIFGIRL